MTKPPPATSNRLLATSNHLMSNSLKPPQAASNRLEPSSAPAHWHCRCSRLEEAMANSESIGSCIRKLTPVSITLYPLGAGVDGDVPEPPLYRTSVIYAT